MFMDFVIAWLFLKNSSLKIMILCYSGQLSEKQVILKNIAETINL